MKGIDLSKNNKVTDWAKVAADGVKFCIIKVTQKDNTIEPSYESHCFGADCYFIKKGGYRYVYAKTVAQAEAEAKALVKVLNGREMPCGIWLDMEDASIKNLGKNTLTNIIDAEAKILRASGYAVGIYCNKDWYKNVLDTKDLNKRYLFWIAGYGKNNGLFTWPNYFAYKSMTNCILWQYTSKGSVHGISGMVDLSCNLVEDPEKLLNIYGK